LYDNEGGHEECSKPETNNDSTNDEDCESVSLSGKRQLDIRAYPFTPGTPAIQPMTVPITRQYP
jgi:hypothetical protein